MSVREGFPPSLWGNCLLTHLPREEYQRLLPELELVTLEYKQILYETGETIRDVYFPIKAVVSMLIRMEKGASIEVGSIGNEGMVGVPVLLEAETTCTQVMVQIPGLALRMKAAVLRSRAIQASPLRRLLYRYIRTFLTQIAQSVACNSLHSLEKRCCRWLLLTRDRVGEDQFPLTQQFLSQMLGVRRASVTSIAGMLQSAGLIRYRRGKMIILDRAGLEAASCECYRIVKGAFEGLG